MRWEDEDDGVSQAQAESVRLRLLKIGVHGGRYRLTAFPVLLDWPEKGIDCFDLMYLESEAVVNTMLRLKREHGVVSLSVHDSIIVPRRHLDLARGVLVQEYERAVGAKPAVKVNEAG